MGNALHVHTRKAGETAIIELHGDVNSDSDATVKTAYRTAVAEGARTILFNMAKTAYINTSGISVLIAVVMEAKKAGQKILVSNVSPHYKKVFDLVRFSVYVTMFDTEEAALNSLTAAPASAAPATAPTAAAPQATPTSVPTSTPASAPASESSEAPAATTPTTTSGGTTS